MSEQGSAAAPVYKMGVDAVGTDLLQHHGYTDVGVLAQWQFKWSEDNPELHGPYNSEEIMAWADDGYFEEGLWIRKWDQEEGHGKWMPWFDVLVLDTCLGWFTLRKTFKFHSVT